MLLTAHQPNYLPYPGFFQKIAAADRFLIVDTTQFVKRGEYGWIHRNRIGTPNGPIWLTLPVLTRGRYLQRIREAELNPRIAWRRKHWRSLEWNYRESPYWERFAPSLRAHYEREWTHLAPFTSALILWFLEVLELDRPVTLASTLAASGRSTEYILAFSKELGATRFLSGVHGRDYLDEERFRSEGIELCFQHYTPPVYATAPGAPATPNLSMIDMLFWCGERAIEWTHRVPEHAAS